MKKLGKLEINPDRLIKNEDLIALKGGYGDSFCGCRNDQGLTICSAWVQTCDNCRNYCYNMCWGWTEAICIGW